MYTINLTILNQFNIKSRGILEWKENFEILNSKKFIAKLSLVKLNEKQIKK